MTSESLTSRPTGFDVARVRRDFPALAQTVHGKPLVYLDSAATALKPEVVIDAISHVYRRDCANIHRAVHTLSMRATQAFEGAREQVRAFLGAQSTGEIVFVRGATEAINLVASSWGRSQLRSGDEIVLTELEHHSNIVPWQFVAQATGAKIVVASVTERGEVSADAVESRFTARTKLVAVSHVSNALGTVLPVAEITKRAHARGIRVLVDGAQAVPHMAVGVRELGCDFYAWSGHKLYGPTGVGVLWAREELLAEMPPYQGGGDMIRSVSFAKTTYGDLPHKFEAGTPDIAGVIGLGAAIGYLRGIGFEALGAHERSLRRYADAELSRVEGLRIVGTAPEKVAVVSFVMDGVHPHDIGTILDMQGVAIRTGHHCAQPLMEKLGLPATARVSFGIYNDLDDVNAAVRALGRVRELFPMPDAGGTHG